MSNGRETWPDLEGPGDSNMFLKTTQLSSGYTDDLIKRTKVWKFL